MKKLLVVVLCLLAHSAWAAPQKPKITEPDVIGRTDLKHLTIYSVMREHSCKMGWISQVSKDTDYPANRPIRVVPFRIILKGHSCKDEPPQAVARASEPILRRIRGGGPRTALSRKPVVKKEETKIETASNPPPTVNAALKEAQDALKKAEDRLKTVRADLSATQTANAMLQNTQKREKIYLGLWVGLAALAVGFLFGFFIRGWNRNIIPYTRKVRDNERNMPVIFTAVSATLVPGSPGKLNPLWECGYCHDEISSIVGHKHRIVSPNPNPTVVVNR